MKTKILTIGMLFLSMTMFSQVYVNNVNLNKTVKSFELHMALKPFTTSQCYYIDYGQNGFKEANYDLKGQGVEDSTHIKFEKGQYMKLKNYLEDQGWVKNDERISKLGNTKIDIIEFKRK